MTLRTKILAIAATLCATAFYAGCDDSSSSPAAPAPTEGDMSSSSVQPLEPQLTSSESIETAEPESSSSAESAPLAESSSSMESEPLAESSSSVEEIEAPVEDCYDGGASITLRSVERINFNCPNSMTMYNYDTWTYYECVGSTLVETEMPPCGM